MHRVTIAIDPALKAAFGPEICWAWRLLLSGIGYAWEEVPLDGRECDIAYVADLASAPRCRVCIRASRDHWERRAERRLSTVARHGSWSHPIYAGEQPIGPALAPDNGRVMCERDLIFDIFWLATGQEESTWPKNVHGYADLAGTAFEREQALRLALASSIGAGVEAALADLGLPAPAPRWPHGRRAAAACGHDVDYPEVIRWLEPLRIARRQGLSGLANAAAVLTGRRTHWHFASWVAMEQRLNARSAFYFVARQGSLPEYAAGTPDPFYDVRSPRFVELFKYLAGEGFEIGLHASYRAYQSHEQLAREKRTLEQASGRPVTGNRHHYWHMDPADPEATLLLHEQAGFTYDTSLVHDRYVGWRRGLTWPFFPFHQRERRQLKTLQVPTGWMDDQLFGQRAYNPGEPRAILHSLAGRVAEQGGCLLIDVHDYVFDAALFPGWAQAYRELWEELVDRGDFWIDTPGRIAEHWSARYAMLTQASRGLVEGSDHGAHAVVRAGVHLPAVPETVHT
jgi:hypothetical protein